MNSKQEYSNLIYEYFLARFHFQYYKQGDTLPAVSTLYQQFGVAEQTVKAALKRLRSEGYLAMHNGMNTRVLFSQTPQEAHQFAARFFTDRWSGILDLVKTSELFMNPFLENGLQHLDNSDLAHLSQVASGSHTNSLLYIFYFVLQKSGNPLVMNLFWEMSLYTGLPFIRDLNTESYMKTLERDLAALCAAPEDPLCWEQLNHTLLTFFETYSKKIAKHLNLPLQLAPQKDCIPFAWRIYRQQPQVCYSLASHILHDIYLGNCQGKEFLPSYQQMADQYQVSVSTVRRTISQLKHVGAVRPMNGRGIRIVSAYSPGNSPDFSDAAVQRNLAFYYQAFELIIYSCEKAAQSALHSLSDVEWAKLLLQLEEYRSSGRCGLTLCYLLRFLAIHSPLHGVQEIYGNIYGLFLFGYSLKFLYEDTTKLEEAEIQFTDSLIRHLREHRAADCGNIIRSFIYQQFPNTEQFLIQCGIQPREMRMSQSLRFLISDGA